MVWSVARILCLWPGPWLGSYAYGLVRASDLMPLACSGSDLMLIAWAMARSYAYGLAHGSDLMARMDRIGLD